MRKNKQKAFGKIAVCGICPISSPMIDLKTYRPGRTDRERRTRPAGRAARPQRLLAEAGHETTPTQPTLEGFRTVAEGCGLIFEDSIALGGSAVLQVCRKRD